MQKQLFMLSAIILLAANAVYSQQATLYGATLAGGLNHKGVLYKMNADGTGYTVLHSFSTSGGYNSTSVLIKASNNMLYGVCYQGGSNGVGCLYQLNPQTNAYSVIFNFSAANGSEPYGVIQGNNGLLYGVTYAGGNANLGVLFSYDLSTNVETVLHHFTSASGNHPSSTLIQATDSMLYGTTQAGGINNSGVIFKYNITGNTYTYVDLKPSQMFRGSLVQLKNGLIYGFTNDTTATGYFNYNPLTDSIHSSSLTYTSSHSFCQDPSGTYLYYSGVNFNSSRDYIGVLNTDSNVYRDVYDMFDINGRFISGFITGQPNVYYGVGENGGNNDSGTVFSYAPSGNGITKLHDFTGGGGGTKPYGNLYYECNGLAPATPGAIVISGGSAKVCPGNVRVYTVPSVAGVTYDWQPPAGSVITSGQGTNSIHITFNTGFPSTGGTLRVYAANGCAYSSAQNLIILRNLPITPSAIIVSGGSATICRGETRTYSIKQLAGITYNWSGPVGATIISGQGTDSVQIQFTTQFLYGGKISVKATNYCGTSTARLLTINKRVPATPGTISGSSLICRNSTHTYSIAPVANAVSYSWTLPPFSSIIGSSNTTMITVHFSALSGSVSVKAVGTCANSATRSLAITFNCREGDSETMIGNMDAQLFPNPTKDKTTLWFTGTMDEHCLITLKDIEGRILISERINANVGSNEHEINLAGFARGIYVITLQTEGYSKQMKVLVN